jgi:tight adherence protein B
MTSSVAIMLAVALAFISLAVMLWSRAERRADHASAERFLDSRFAGAQTGAATQVKSVGATPTSSIGRASLDKSAGSGIPGAPMRSSATSTARATGNPASSDPAQRRSAARSASTDTALRWLDDVLSRAGIRRRPPFALAAGIPTTLIFLLALSRLGLLGAVVTGGVCIAIVFFVLSVLTSRRHQALVRQLPPFLDAIVRLLTIGNSIPSAFQTATGGTEEPLKECLERVSRMLRSGVELDRALYQTARAYKLQELELLAAVMRLAVKYGGRADVVLERMSGFMRDLDMAQRELVALSAETRLSAWVLCLLPILIGGFLIIANPQYFASMWLDGFGRELLYGAGALQVLGCFLLYRMAKL